MLLIMRWIGTALVVAALAASPVARAADATGSGNLILARQLIQAAGGEEEMRAMLTTLSSQLSARLNANISSQQARQRDAIAKTSLDRLLAATPEIIDRAAEVYARTLTDQEMRDWIAWLRSDSGQAITREIAVGAPQTDQERRDAQTWANSESGRSVQRKQAAIQSATIQVMAPIFVRATEGFKTRGVDDACREVGCTVEDRAALEAAMKKAFSAPTD
jgi:hypothetical protein